MFELGTTMYYLVILKISQATECFFFYSYVIKQQVVAMVIRLWDAYR